MAKTKLSHYVDLLMELTDGQSWDRVEQNFAGFLTLLMRQHQLSDLDEILALFAQLQDRKHHRLTATVHYHQMPDASQLAQIEKFLQKHYQVDQVQLQLTDDGVGAGLIVDTPTERFDLSLAGQISRFKQQLISQEN